jgi:hypothetical protein
MRRKGGAQVKTGRRTRQLLALQNRLDDAQDAAERLGWPDVQAAVQDVLDLVQHKADAELEELEDVAGDVDH